MTGIALAAHLGLGTPVGYAGAALEWTPLPSLTLAAGGGLGAAGPQAAVLGRVRWRNEDTAWGLGAGVSAGRYIAGPTCDAVVCDDGTEHPRKAWDLALWGNGEVFYEWWASSRVFLRPYLGVGVVLNPGAGQKDTSVCDEVRCDGFSGVPPERALVYTGLSVGYAWSL